MSIIYCDEHCLKWDSDLKSECPFCSEEWLECSACNGNGIIRYCLDGDLSRRRTEYCPACNGKGYIEDAQLQRERIDNQHGEFSK